MPEPETRSTTREILHDENLGRYTLTLGGNEVGVADYRIQGDAVVFTHTEINPSFRHGGLGGALIQGALDDVAANSTRRVVALCPFVSDWIDAHPEYSELTTRGH
jgi:predicted GNAT family acetyltransferase